MDWTGPGLGLEYLHGSGLVWAASWWARGEHWWQPQHAARAPPEVCHWWLPCPLLGLDTYRSYLHAGWSVVMMTGNLGRSDLLVISRPCPLVTCVMSTHVMRRTPHSCISGTTQPIVLSSNLYSSIQTYSSHLFNGYDTTTYVLKPPFLWVPLYLY